VETGSVDPLRYQRPEEDASETRRAGEEDELMFVKLRYKAPDGERSRLLELPVPDRVENASTDLRFAASVAAFGMLLRDSEQCGDFTLGDISRLARASLGEDRHGYRAEFVRLVEATRELSLLEG
jgi:Ca-activated chloride channel family protein